MQDQKIYFIASYKKRHSGRLKHMNIFVDNADAAVKDAPSHFPDDPRYRLYGISKMSKKEV